MPRRKGDEDLNKLLAEKSKKEGTCLIWHGAWGGAGYGYVTIDGRRISVRRLSYELHHGVTVTDAQTVVRRKELCSHVRCINPKHLVLRERGKGGRQS